MRALRCAGTACLSPVTHLQVIEIHVPKEVGCRGHIDNAAGPVGRAAHVMGGRIWGRAAQQRQRQAMPKWTGVHS